MKLSVIAGLVGSALLTTSLSVQADDQEYVTWGAGFFEFYKANRDKPLPDGGLRNGYGFGAEIGKQFSDRWAGRVEFAFQDLNGDSDAQDENGQRVGVDALYFVNDKFTYIFGGYKHQSLDETYRLFNYGAGKHWYYKDNLRIITEAAVYHDVEENLVDFGLKIGLAYHFGGNGGSSNRNSDGDNDGVYDRYDECPTTPAGQTVDSRGCSTDSDNDGVLNSVDQCPNTPPGTAVDARGCALPKDSDSDGVYDDKDQCPNTPRGAKVNAVGCSIETDKDGDGVIDRLDRCPGTPKTDKVDDNGCSIFTENEVSIELDVKFANDSAEVESPNHPNFVAFAAFLNRFPDTKAEISGHSSKVGDADYNLALSQRRADAVKKLMVEQYGINTSRLIAKGYGEERPLDDSNTAAAARVNRRIEAVVTASEKVKVKK